MIHNLLVFFIYKYLILPNTVLLYANMQILRILSSRQANFFFKC